MSKYDKGARGERELIEILEEKKDYACLRAPASGASTKRELPDVLAGNGDQVLVLEVKRWSKDKDYQYLTKKEVHDLKYFAEVFGGEYYIAARFDYGSWGFFKIEDLKETEKNYRVDTFKSVEGKGINDVA